MAKVDRKLTDEKSAEPLKVKPHLQGKDVKKLLTFISGRWSSMSTHRDRMGVIQKWDRYDRMYTPSSIATNSVVSRQFEDAKLATVPLDDQGRESQKSKPLAYEKISIAIGQIIDQNPKVTLKSFLKKHELLTPLLKQSYEYNWKVNRLTPELRKFTFNLAKYSLAFGRRYYKKVPRIIKVPKLDDKGIPMKKKNGDPLYDKQTRFEIDDVIWENIDPRRVLVDENCTNVQKDARDTFLETIMDKDAFDDEYPEELYPEAEFVQEGIWVENKSSSDNATVKSKTGAFRKIDAKQVQVLIYENKPRDSYHIIANGVLLTPVDNPLPYKHKNLSIFNAKWSEGDPESIYDAIGICDILELYQPILDELDNATTDQVRMRVKPWMLIGRGLRISDEGDDEPGLGKRIFIDGDISQVKWEQPPAITDGDIRVKEMLREDVDAATGISRELAGLSEADTAFQAAQNIANARKRLRLPLDNIEMMLEDDARLAIPLLQQIYSNPIKTEKIIDADDLAEYEEAIGKNPDDPRFVQMPNGDKVRRRFRTMQLNLKRVEQDLTLDPRTGQPKELVNRIVETENEDFWEHVPVGFDWEGIINIVPMSFLPVSHELEVQDALNDLELLLSIQSTDDEGNPTLLDENGQPFAINRVKLLKDYLKLKDKDANEIIVRLEKPEATALLGGGDSTSTPSNPLTDVSNITPGATPNVGGNTPENFVAET